MLIICPIAGVGSYLRPFVVSKPKAMIKIAGKRIIDHIMGLLKQYFPKGTNICFIVFYLKRIITSYIADNYGDYFDIVFEEQKPLGYKDDIPYFSGIGDAIYLAEKYGRDDDCFIFFSDRYPTDDYSPLFKKLEKDNLDGVINVTKIKEIEPYGVCILNSDGNVRKVVEKPKEFISDLAISWGYVFSEKITGKLFDLLKKQAENPHLINKEHDFTSIIQKLINGGAKIGINIMKSPILDFGRVNDFLKGNLYLLNQERQNVTDESEFIKSKKIMDSIIIHPVDIGENCEITNSVIGPNVSIGNNVNINKSVLNDVVIGDNTTLDQVITEKSVIGDFVTLENIIKKSISIGDSSNISTRKQ